jgi:hypothetical protein
MSDDHLADFVEAATHVFATSNGAEKENADGISKLAGAWVRFIRDLVED